MQFFVAGGGVATNGVSYDPATSDFAPTVTADGWVKTGSYVSGRFVR